MAHRTMYMHTLDGRPARFDPLWQIIHRVPPRARAKWGATLVASMDEIREQRRLSRRQLRREKMVIPRYGYVLVSVP